MLWNQFWFIRFTQNFSLVVLTRGPLYCAAAAVAGLFGNIALRKELLFIQFRVEVSLHTDVLVLYAPEHKLLHRALRAIGVEHLEPVALDEELVADGFQ